MSDKREAIAGLPILLLLLGLVGAAGEYRHRTAGPAALARGSWRRASSAREGGRVRRHAGSRLRCFWRGLAGDRAAAAGERAGRRPRRSATSRQWPVGASSPRRCPRSMGVAVGALVRNQVAAVIGTLDPDLRRVAVAQRRRRGLSRADAVGRGGGAGRRAPRERLLGRSGSDTGRLDSALADRGDHGRTKARRGVSDAGRPGLRRAPAARSALVGARRRARAARHRRRVSSRSRAATDRRRRLVVLTAIGGGALILRRSAPRRGARNDARGRGCDRGHRQRARRPDRGQRPHRADRGLHGRRNVRATRIPRRARCGCRRRRDPVGRDRRRRGPGDVRPRRRDHRDHHNGRDLGAREPTPRRGVGTCASSRNAPSKPNASASSWPESRSTRSAASIARELHDIVAHSVSVMLVGVRGARDVLRTAPEVADETLARVETSGEQSLTELRRILALLRGPEQGAESRPQPSLADLDELVAEYRDVGLARAAGADRSTRVRFPAASSSRSFASSRKRSRTCSSTPIRPASR